MANQKISVQIETKANLQAVTDFQKAFQRAFKTPVTADMAKRLMEIGQRLQKIGGYRTPIEALKKGLDLSSILGKSNNALKTLVQAVGPGLGKNFKYARTESELLRRATQKTRVTDLVNDLRSTANALKPIRTSLIKTDEGFRAIYVKTQLIKEKLIAHRTEVTRLRDRVANLRREYDASAETAKTANQVRRLGELKKKLDLAEVELKRKVTLYEKDIIKAKIQQDSLLKQTNAKLTGQKIAIAASAQEERKLSDTAKVFLNTAKAQQEAAVRLTAEKKKQQQIDTARREAYALTIAGNQLKSYGNQFAVVGRQAADAFAEIDFQIRRASAASGISFVDDMQSSLRPVQQVNQQLSLMGDTAKRAAEQLGFIPTEEVARGMYFFASTTGEGFNSVEELNKSMSQLTPIMQAASITGSDLETSIKGVYGVVNQFALPMEDASKVTEMLYYAAQKTAAEFPDFIESLKMLGPVAHQAGVGFEDTLKSLAVLADSGIRGSTAGRALRQMFLQLNDPADRATQILDKAASRMKGTGTVFKDLVYDAKGNFLGMANYIKVMAQMTDQLTQRQKTQLLGMIATAAETPALTKLIEAESAAMKQGKSIIEDNTKAIGDAQKANEMFSASVDLVTASTKASLGRIDVSINNIKATFGEAMAPALEKLSYAIAGISERFDAFAKNNPKLMQTITLLGGIAAAAAILGGSILAVVGAFKLVTKAAFPTLLKDMKAGSSIAQIFSNALGGGLDDAARIAGTTSKEMSGVGKIASSVGGIFGGLKAKITAPFAAISKGGGAATKIFGIFGKVLGPFGAIFKVLGLKIQAIITAVVGFFTGFIQGMNRGKESADGFSGVMSALEPIISAVGAALGVLTDAFNLLYEVARWVGIQLGKLFGEGGALKPIADIIGAMFSVFGWAMEQVGGAIRGVTGDLKNLNDQAIGPHAKELEDLDSKLRGLEAQRQYSSGVAQQNIQKEIDKLKAQRQAVLDLMNAELARDRVKGTGQTWGANSDIRESRARVAAAAAAAGGGGGGGGGLDDLFGTDTSTTTKQTPQEKALELAQQAASLAEALYKIEGLDLKALIRKTMGKVAEAMKLAIKLSAPYAKAFSAKTLEAVSNFSNAVGSVASAVGGMVDAAEKLATYKAPKPAAIKKIVTDMSVAMKAMIAEAKKFTGSQVAVVQFYADSATAVVGAIAAAVDAFNSMATGVYQPPANVLKQIAKDISRAVQEFTKQLATAPTQPMLDKAKAFAEAADAVLGTIGNAIGAFKDLRNYVKPLPSMLQAVVDTIEIAVRQMLVSMGKFSLNKDQWEVVNTFATVAKAIADAVGGTYDAFVKQMDFVDQFREEIDYNKVFGWIEDGIRKMADIAGAMPVGMVQMAKDAAEAATAIAGALDAFFKLATETGGDPALLSDSLLTAVNSVLAIIEAFASTTQVVGAKFVDSLIAGMQSRESALSAEAARLTAILGTAAGNAYTRSNSNTITINHVVTDPNGVLKNASSQEVAKLLSGDVFISNLQHSIKTQ